MRAGRLRYRITLREPSTVTGPTGATKVTWTDTVTVWAERVRISGNSVVEASEDFSDYRTDYNIREAHTVDEKWQVQEENGHLYIVTNIIPNIQKGYKTLQCVRYNE